MEPPLSELCDLSVSLSATKRSGLFGSPRAPSTSALSKPGPWSCPPSPCSGTLSNAFAIHSQVFTLPQGLTGDRLNIGSGSRDRSSSDVVPLMGFCSLQRTPAPRIRFSRGTHSPAPCVFRVRTSLDAFLSFEPSNHFWPGRSWDSTFRALLNPPSRRCLSAPPNPPDVAHPDRCTLAIRSTGPNRLRGS